MITTGNNLQVQQEKENAFCEERFLRVWAKYSNTAKFSKEDFHDLFFYFEQEMEDGQCTWQQFKNMFYIVYPIEKDPFVDKLSIMVFKRVDRNKNGRISFQEFICWLSKMTHGSDEQKMTEIFKMYDADKNGVLTRSELISILHCVDKMGGDMRLETNVFGRIDEIFTQCDKNRDDQLKLNEFLAAAKLEPIANIFKERHPPFVERDTQECPQ